MAESYRNRIELPRVLEEVHRKSAIMELGMRGIQLAQNTPWPAIDELRGEDAYHMGNTLYEGAAPVDGLFDEANWRLHGSGATVYGRTLAKRQHNFAHLHEHLKIDMFKYPDWAEVFMIPDAPPFALRTFRLPVDIAYQLEGVSDARILEMTQREGGEAFEFIDETTAGNLIHALQTDHLSIAQE